MRAVKDGEGHTEVFGTMACLVPNLNSPQQKHAEPVWRQQSIIQKWPLCQASTLHLMFGDGESGIQLILGIKAKGEKDIVASKTNGQLAN